MQTIPLNSVPSQGLSVNLAGQSCTINVYQKTTGLFLDLTVNGVVIVTGALCLDRVAIVRMPYAPFVGELAFFDQLGTTDPVYTGLGSRYLLLYLSVADVNP